MILALLQHGARRKGATSHRLQVAVFRRRLSDGGLRRCLLLSAVRVSQSDGAVRSFNACRVEVDVLGFLGKVSAVKEGDARWRGECECARRKGLARRVQSTGVR